MKVIGYQDASGDAVTEADAVAQGAPAIGAELKLRPMVSDHVDGDGVAMLGQPVFPALGELPAHPTGPTGRHFFGGLDLSKCIDPTLPEGCVRIDGRVVRVAAADLEVETQRQLDPRVGQDFEAKLAQHTRTLANREFRARKFSTLTDAEVKEVMAYDLTPRARAALNAVNPTVGEAQTLKGSDLLLFNALAGDSPVEQMLPPPIPVTQQQGFKAGVFCGLLVGSGVVASLPYLVEMLKGWIQ